MIKPLDKIDKLIAELCPEGVEVKDVGKLIENKAVTTVNPPKKLTKRHYKPIGAIPIVDQGQNFIVGYTDDSKALVANGLYVIFGDHTEAIKYVDFAFAQGADGIKILKTHMGIINTRFFYYALNNFYEKAGKYTRHYSFLKKTKIPIPPLAIQQEIVKILDTFTALEAELEAELEARKKQYEYYRASLFEFEEEKVEWKILGDVYDFQYGEGNTIPTSGGEYPVYGSNGIVGSHSRYNSEDAPVIGHIGAYAGIVNWAQGKHFVTYNGVICRIKNGVDPKFGYYFLQLQDFRSMANSGSQPFVSYDMLRKVRIPIPDITTQQGIVAILDKFDQLVNDISVGLPAELNARRKQYEYYRNKLLTFKPLEKVHANQYPI